MFKKYLTVCLAGFFAAGFYSSVFAQGAPDVLRYGLQYPSGDPVSLVMPGVSTPTGFGAYQENPAVMGLFDESFYSIGLSDRYVNEDGSYLGNTSNFDNNQLNISNAGFVYNVPTKKGKLTFGAGYSQSHDFNRTFSVNGRNNQSSITDAYATTTDDALFNIAFNAFAIDHVDPDNDSSPVKSIFRVDSPYKGISQDVELTERGTLGEYSAFIATEFQKDFYVGASVGVITGTYTYRRDFLETDTQNDYDSQFVDGSGNLYGIDNILSHDSINDDFTAFSLRLGAVYKISPHVNIGGSYQFKNKLDIKETFNTTITTTFDDGSNEVDDAPAEFKYKVVRPARINLGISAKDISGFTISGSVERVDYSQGKIEFGGIQSKTDENDVNNIVRANLDDVFNMRLGLSYMASKQFEPRIGYGYYPSPSKNTDADRQFVSGGFTAHISANVKLNVGVQYATWKDQSTLYTYDDGNAFIDEVASEDVHHWNVMGGLSFAF